MTTYDTPGAYIERADRAQGGINRLRVDVAAFVGIAERGPAQRAVAVESWKQFLAIFGGLFVHGYLGYVVKAFFENGGRRCWVVRVQGEAAAVASGMLHDAAAAPVWALEASSSGSWGNSLGVRLVEIRRAVQRSTASTPDWADVRSSAGFARADTVELVQESAAGVARELRVLSAVEPGSGRLIWNHFDPATRLPSDVPLALVDPGSAFRIESVAYQLQVSLNGRPWRVYDDLALAPDHPRYGPKLVNGVSPLFVNDASRSIDPYAATTAELVTFGKRTRTDAVPEPVRLVELRGAPRATACSLRTPSAGFELVGGLDGLSSLRAQDFIGAEAGVDDSDRAVLAGRRGIAALGEIDEIGIVAVPDIHIQPRSVELVTPPPCVPDPCLPGKPLKPARQPAVHDDPPPRFTAREVERVIAALVNHCELHRDRIAVLDTPHGAATRAELGVAAVRDFRRLFDSSYAALYFPWLEVRDELPQARERLFAIPPCGHVAGQFAATDLRTAVHKAPANVPLLMAEDTTFAVDEATHGLLNMNGVNVIRALPGRGLRIAGARLVSQNPNLRFVNVRRQLLMIERSIEQAVQWAVFEGNDWLTRAKVMLSIDGFLRELWGRGALVGAAPQEAFYVRCDETNNTHDGRARGELLVEVGVAPSVPFEFVVLRIGRVGNGFEWAEASTGGAATWH